MIKARAYRPGERVNPVELSGTHATVTSTAVFDKTELIEPSAVAKLVAGVKYRYWEGDWQDLWQNLDTKAPAKTGTCGGLWGS